MAPAQWQAVLDELCVIAHNDPILKGIENLQSEEDLVKIFLSGKYCDKLLDWIKSVYSFTSWRKCEERARLLREDGNKHFRQKKYSKSLLSYSESIKYAEVENKEFPLSLANRAAALTHLNRFKDALQDIDLALNNGYPASLCYKLYQRKGNCLMQLQNYDEALTVLKLAQEALKASKTESAKDEDNIKQVSKIIENMLAVVLKNVNGKCGKKCYNETEAVLPKPIFGESKEFPCASKSLKLMANEEKGRHVITTQDLSVGDILFVEEPYAYVLLPEHYRHRCHHCCNTLRIPIPCWECTQVLYCGEECRLTSWNQYHQWECHGGLHVVDSVGIAHLGLRVVLIAGSLAKHKKFKGSLSGELDYQDRYSAIYHLVTNLEVIAADDRIAYSLTAACLVLYLQWFTNYFMEDSSKKVPRKNHVRSGDSILIGGVILRHICQLVCNGHAITAVEEVDSGEECFDSSVQEVRQFRIATAIYPSASMMNHSCDPNIINSFQGTTIVIKAYKAIKKGEEVYNCYGPNYRSMSRQERQEALKAQYHFDCSCTMCASKTDFEVQFMAWKCPMCNGPIKGNDIKNNKMCSNCGNRIVAGDILLMVNNCHDLYMKGCGLLESGQTKEAIECLEKCLSIQEKCLYKNHKQQSMVLDTLAKSFAIMGDYGNSILYLHKTLPAVEVQFGSWSIEMAHELQKLSDVMICDLQCGTYNEGLFKVKRDQVREVVQKAKDIFQLHYGPWNTSLQTIINKEKKLNELGAAINVEQRI